MFLIVFRRNRCVAENTLRIACVESPVLTGNRGAKRRETCSNQWFTTDLKASAQQCTQLVDQLAEQRQRVVDGRARAHVDTHVAQQLDRLFRAAAGEELLVVLDGALALAQDAVGDGDGGGEAGRRFWTFEESCFSTTVSENCGI